MNAPDLSVRRANVAVGALSLGTALNPLNSSMIAVALVVLRKDFGLNVTTVTWVITAFYLASAAGQPLMGRLADRFGSRRLFVFGMALVVVVCALTPFSPTFAFLCVGRIFLAIGTATAFPSAIAMLKTITEQAGLSSPRLIGRIQIANTSGAAIGPVIGGILVTTLGWQAIFWVNVPLAVLAMIGTRLFAPADAVREREPMRVTIGQSDIPGILAFAATLVALLIFLLSLPSGPAWWLVPVTLAACAVFIWREMSTKTPFIDLRLLAANHALMMVYLCFAIFNLIYYCAFFGLPQFLEDQGGYRTDIVGLLMFPLAALSVVITPFAARLIERRGLHFTLNLGGSMLLLSAALLGLIGLTTSPVVVLLITAAMGIPYCIVSIAMSQALYASVRPQDAGVAAGIFQTSRYVGAILATALLGMMFASGTTSTNWLLVIAVATALAVVLLGLLIVWRARRAPDAATRS
jgi:MFS family permease